MSLTPIFKITGQRCPLNVPHIIPPFLRFDKFRVRGSNTSGRVAVCSVYFAIPLIRFFGVRHGLYKKIRTEMKGGKGTAHVLHTARDITKMNCYFSNPSTTSAAPINTQKSEQLKTTFRSRRNRTPRSKDM